MHADPLEAGLAFFPDHSHVPTPLAAPAGLWSHPRALPDRLSLGNTQPEHSLFAQPGAAMNQREIRPRRHRREFMRAETASRVQALRAKKSGGALAYCRAWALAQGALVFARCGNVPSPAPVHALADQTARNFETICPDPLRQAHEHLAAARSEDCASRTTRLYAVRKHFERVIELAKAVPCGKLETISFSEARPRYELLLAAHRGLAAMALPDAPEHLRHTQRIAARMTMHTLREKSAGFCFPHVPLSAELPRWPNAPRRVPAADANYDARRPELPPSIKDEFAF